MKATSARGSLVLAVALAASTIVIAPAGAATLQNCAHLTGSALLTPGLTTTPHAQTATAKATLTSCVPLKTTGGSGTLAATLKLPSNSSCQGLVGGGQTIKLAATVKWKNGKSSKMALTAVTGKGSLAAAMTAKITGSVSSGLFLKHKVATTIKISTPSSENCSPGHPVRHITIKNTKPFTIT